MKKIFFILFIILVAIFLLKSSPKKHDFSNLSILSFGDSLTYGYNAASSKSYPSVLANLLNAKVANKGVNGEVSKDGLKRLKEELDNKHYDILILCHGGNDFLRKEDISKTKQNIKDMVFLAKQKNIFVLLVAVPFPKLNIFGIENSPIYQEIANEENIALEDEALKDILSSPSLKSDHIHPNEKGYEEFANFIAKKLQKTYPR